ncbi:MULTISPECIES: tyrosine-type recombinase/integrase [unclassified Marinovum]
MKSIKTAFYAALERAGLQDVRVHDIRHTSAVWMLESGSSIQRISQYLGHSSIQQTFKVYARYQPDFLRAEAAALDVTPLLAYDPEHEVIAERDLQSGVGIHFTSTQTSITIDRKIEPEFAIFVKENSDTVLSDLRTKFEKLRKVS